MKEYKIKKVTLNNGETIAYREAGSGEETLMLIHGNMSSSVQFSNLIEKFSGEYRVVAPDLRGFGDSSYNSGFDSLGELAEDMSDFIKILDLNNITVLGWSTGGGVVLELSLIDEVSDKIKNLILMSSVGPQGYKMYKKDAKGMPILDVRLSTREEISTDPVQVLPILNAYETKNKDFIKMVYNSLIYNLKQPDESEYDLYLDGIIKQRNLVDIDYSLVHFNITDKNNGVAEGTAKIDKINTPTLIVHGKLDLVVPVADAIEMDKYLKNSKLSVLDGVGHSILTDDIELLVKEISDFIKS